MSLRLHLPPNLAKAVLRDAIPVRVEFEADKAPEPVLLPALALLQRWCMTPTLPPFLQLTRAQLRELARALGPAPVWIENARALPWSHDELLKEAPAAPAIPVPTPARPRRTASDEAPMVVDGSEHFLSITLPSREHFSYAAALELVKGSGFILEPSNRRWWIRDRHKVLTFLASNLKRLRDRLGAEFTENFEKHASKIKAATIECSADLQGDSLAVSVGLGAGTADPSALRAAQASNRPYVEADGLIYLIDAEEVRRIEEVQRALLGDPAAAGASKRTHRLALARAPEVEELLTELLPGFAPSSAWRQRTQALKSLSVLPRAPAPPELAAQMRPYQQLGSAWLWYLAENRLGGILADEMGLGKTLQALAVLACPDPAGPATSLVVCPASLVENWRREAARFAPSLRVHVHHGQKRLTEAGALGASDLVITSYGTLARDRDLFSTMAFRFIVADEAQHIKNRRSQNAQALKSLSARARFVLTGTPLENSLDDLRSLFEFLMPGYLERVPPGLKAQERSWYDARLKAKTAPYILRRTKAAVAPELPEKIEQVIWCDFTAAQRSLYQKTQEKSERELIDMAAAGASESSLKFAALTQLLRLRQICCDPRLLEPTRPDEESAKLDAFRELVAEAADDGHRLLVFSQFTSLLALLRDELAAQAIPFAYFDGSMTPKARQAQVDLFQTTPSVLVFLISLKAGGTGLNLTAADTVIHYDPWWNPAAEAQATDRAHRIGQRRTVTSYKLICAGSVEERVLALQATKRALLEGVFEASDTIAQAFSLEDLKGLITPALS